MDRETRLSFYRPFQGVESYEPRCAVISVNFGCLLLSGYTSNVLWVLEQLVDWSSDW